MKIALLTIWHCGNYGAEMQAYATLEALQKLGHEVELIDFPLTSDGSPSLKSRIANVICLLSPANKKFQAFWKLHFPHVTKVYRNVEELRNNPPLADMYIVGSDQVWNPDITDNKASAYFLDFGSDNIKRASFSSSFGVHQWKADSNLTEIASSRLRQFCGISCREQTGVAIIGETFGIPNAEQTIDPTLLFENYSEITGPLHQQPTLVYYPLSAEDKTLKPFCEEIAEKMNLTLVNANPYQKLAYTNVVWNRNSIQDWIKSIAEARFVITPSFHGVAFSIIHHRQFAVLNLAKHGRLSRISCLLSQLGLSERLFTNMEEMRQSDIFNTPIDYNDVDEKLQILRNRSWDYLKRITS